MVLRRRALVGLEILRAGRRARAGLRLADLTLIVMEQVGHVGTKESGAQVRAELAPAGKTLDETAAGSVKSLAADFVTDR